MLRRSALSAGLVALSACYVGLPQDETASDASAGSTSPDSNNPDSNSAGSNTAGSATASSNTAGPLTTTTVSSAGSTDMSAGTGTTDALTAGPVSTDSLDTGEPATGNASTSGTTGLAETGETGASETGVSETGVDETGEPPDPVALLCGRWKSDRAELGEGMWSGAVAGCDPGTLSQVGRDNALRLVNLYRFIASLPPVTEDAALTSNAQSCALMMHANGQLSHTPPMKWKCWTAAGSGAASKSNISGTPGVLGVDLYMVDPGNDTTIGHRRWILSNYLGPIGLGSTTKYSCLTVIGGMGNAGKAWMAWPPPGLVPYQAMHVPTINWADVDQTGWTVQSDTIDLSAAGVSVTEGGVDKPVTVNVLGKNFGSSQAIRFVPKGWTVEPGKTYDVELSGVAQPISYSVQIVDCP